jgi:universal stress protein E
MADKKILVVVDPTATAEQPVIERAAWLATLVSGEIELVIVDFDAEINAGQVSTVWIKQPDAKNNLIEIHRANLEKLAEGVRAKGLTVSVDVVWDQPLGEAIVRKVVASKPWLVAKDTHHHSVLKRTVLSNTDWHLIRGCPAPLWLVKPDPIAATPKIYAAVDPLHEHDKPAELDDRIFSFADAIAKATKGELHVVHAFSAPVGVDLPGDVIEQIAAQHRSAMQQFLTKHSVPAERAHVLSGAPSECLLEATAEGAADIVVMGAVSRRGLNKLFVGSTATRVLDRLHCDLVIVKPAGFEPDRPHSD